MISIMIVQRSAAAVILLSLIALTGPVLSYDVQGTDDGMYEDYADSIRVRGALLLIADPCHITMPAGYSRLNFSFVDKAGPSGKLSALQDCVVSAVIDGEIVSPVSAKQLEGVNLDNELLSAFEQYNIASLIRRIGNWVPGNSESGAWNQTYDLSRYYEIAFPDSLIVENIEAAFSTVLSPEFVSPKPIPIVDTDENPNPPLPSDCNYWDDSTGGQWHLDSCGIFDAWGMICPSVGDNVVVAIIDAGFGLPPSVDPHQGFHPDILPNIHDKSRVNWDAGYTSDHGTGVIGVGFAAADYGIPPIPSIVCQKPGNGAIIGGYGTIGTAPHAKVIALSFNDNPDSIDYCHDFQYVLDSCPEVRIMSFSWGIRYSDSLLEAQIGIAFAKGILLLASSGNCKMLQPCPFTQYPASSPFVHAIGATSMSGNRWGTTDTGHILNYVGSNYHECGYVELAAPGAGILIPGPPKFKFPQDRDSSINYFHRDSGTSLSTPLVAGVSALIMSAYPDIGPETVFDIMARTTQEEFEEPDIYKGYGLVRADKALRYIQTVGLCHDTVNGDVDANGFVNFEDVRYLQDWIFRGGPEPPVCDTIGGEAFFPLADANGDCSVNSGDIEYIANYLFSGGDAPVNGCAYGGNYASEFDRQTIGSINFPNPFNPMTTITFTLTQDQHVTLRVYNILGQEIITLVNGILASGPHSIAWDGCAEGGNPAASGIYLYELVMGQSSETRKMILMK